MTHPGGHPQGPPAGYGGPPNHAGQPPYDAPPGYGPPGQPPQAYPGYGPPGYPQPPRVVQRPNPLAAGLACVGLVLSLLGGLVVDWFPWGTLLDQARMTWSVRPQMQGLQHVVATAYVLGVAYLLVLAGVVHALLFTLGVIKSKRAAALTFGLVAIMKRPNPVPGLRILFLVGGAVLLGLHLWGILAVFGNDLGLAGPGVWLVLGGVALTAAAGAIGPLTQRTA